MRIRNTLASVVWKLLIVLVGASGLALRCGLVTSALPPQWTGSLDVTATHYFANLIAAVAVVYWLCDIVYVIATHRRSDTRGAIEPSFKYTVTMCLLVVLLVTHVILRQGYFFDGSLDWGFLSLHYVLPVMALMDWLLFDKKGQMHAWGPCIWTSLALLYVLVTELLVAGLKLDLAGDAAISGTGSYPYAFLDATVRGPLTVLRVVGILYVFFTVVGYVIFALDKLMAHFGGEDVEPEDEPDYGGVVPPREVEYKGKKHQAQHFR